jgi:hypothetical protein
MCAAMLKQEINFSAKIAAIPDVQPTNDVWALVRAQTKPKTIRPIAWLAGLSNISVNVRRAVAAVAISAIVAFSLYSIKPEAPTQTSVNREVHTTATTVKWADDPLGNHSDAMVEFINNM